MSVGALAQIHSRKMEAEHFHRADEGLQALRGDDLAVMRAAANSSIVTRSARNTQLLA